ncbi:MAG: exonuclease SbcC [Marinoscillum sp.]|jgi:exonuclease SbcC
MKILSIEIYNLASLEGQTTIDFTEEPLASAGIFAITGPTGAGKSTLLDALCLALYGKTPRYLQAKEMGIEVHDVHGSTINQGDVRGILRDGTAEGHAKVAFVGADGQRYLASWSVRRARQRVDGTIQADSMQLDNLDTGRTIASKKTEVLKEIEQAIGLNFDQFTRSVLLAQGDFSAFLKANKDEKSSLLEKLTGTHVYSEISIGIFEKYKLVKADLDFLQLKAEGVESLTEEDILIQKEQQRQYQEDETVLDKKYAKYQKAKDWVEREQKLAKEHEEALLMLDIAKQTQEDSAERKVKLALLDQVQAIRSEAILLHQKKHEQNFKEGSVIAKESDMMKLNQVYDLIQSKLEKANQSVLAFMQKREEAEPLLEQASKLDTQLATAEEHLKTAKQEAEVTKTEFQKEAALVQEAHGQKDSVQTDLLELEKWQQTNASRQPIAENKSLIISKLADAESHWDGVQQATKKLESVEGEIKQKTQAVQRWNEERESLQIQITAQQNAWEMLNTEVEATPLAALETKNSALQIRKDALNEGRQWWEKVVDAEGIIGQLHLKIATLDKQLEGNKDQSIEARKELERAKETRNASQKMLERIIRESTKEVETLRQDLEKDMPCPVCGSTQHPYAEAHPQLTNVMKSLEQTHQEYEEDYDAKLQQITSFEKEQQQWSKELDENQRSLKGEMLKLVENQQQWQVTPHASEAEGIDEMERSKWLKEQSKQNQDELGTITRQLEEQRALVARFDREKKTLDSLKEDVAKVENAVQKSAFDLKSLQDKSAHDLEDQEQYGRDLASIEKSLIPYFEHAEWLENWKSNPEDFKDRLKGFATDWEEKKIALEAARDKLRKITSDLEVFRTRESTASKANQKAGNVLEQATNLFQSLTQERKKLFDGEALALVKSKLSEAHSEADGLLQAILKEKESYADQLKECKTKISHWNADISTLQRQIDQLTKKIGKWRETYNENNQRALSHEMLVDLLNVSTDWITEERQALQEITNALNKAETTLTERKLQLNNHQSARDTEVDFEKLEGELIETKSALDQTKSSIEKISFELQKDQENKARIGTLLKQIENKRTSVDDWAKLSELIGSADGKKFRQIAQEYTLDVLLSYANVHLTNLTPRYQIDRISDTLGLQVLDHDMGDEYRTVYSLSGGESFLVSLALALGLASVSSSRMKIESLFIDEGFGSLDPATLNIAMDALERLHNQGRKVGVISHVEEMKERIPVQIKVMKLSNGKSKLEI